MLGGKRLTLRNPLPFAFLIILLLATFSSDGLFIVDELIYFMSSEAMGNRHSLTIENGYEELGLETLLLRVFLVPGPNGLAPQYPIGAPLLYAIPVSLLGTKGMVYVNAFFACGVLFITRQISLILSGDIRAANLSTFLLMFGTFFLEYAVGIWPHMPSIFFVNAALFCGMMALPSEKINETSSFYLSLLSGLMFGAALLIRSDSILALFPLASMAILYSTIPLKNIFAGFLGLSPALLASSFANMHKFGTPNPLTYGTQGGGGDLFSHSSIILAGFIGLVFLIALRIGFRDRRVWITLIAVSVPTAIFSVAISHSAQAFLQKFTMGFLQYVLDSRNMPDGTHGLTRELDGTTRMFDQFKKALIQSIPWLSIFTLLPFSSIGANPQRARQWFLLVILGWWIPIITLGWHGGFGYNMRYFLPTLPIISVVAAPLWLRLIDDVSFPRHIILVGLATGASIFLLSAQLGPGGANMMHYSLPVWAFSISVLSILFSHMGGKYRSQRLNVALLSLTVAFFFSFVSSLGDLVTSQFRRFKIAAVNDTLSQHVVQPSLMIGLGETYAFQVGNPRGLIGRSYFSNLKIAAEHGYSIYVPESGLEEVLSRNPELEKSDVRIETVDGAVVLLQLK